MTIDIIQEANERSHIICSVEALKGEFSFIFIALYILFKVITFFSSILIFTEYFINFVSSTKLYPDFSAGDEYYFNTVI